MTSTELRPTQPLKPCPFCGGDRLVVTGTARLDIEAHPEWADDPDAFAYTVHCTSCACDGPWFKSAGNAEHHWNGIPGTWQAARPQPPVGSIEAGAVKNLVDTWDQDAYDDGEWREESADWAERAIKVLRALAENRPPKSMLCACRDPQSHHVGGQGKCTNSDCPCVIYTRGTITEQEERQ